MAYENAQKNILWWNCSMAGHKGLMKLMLSKPDNCCPYGALQH